MKKHYSKRMNCPICQTPIQFCEGTRLNPKDGVTAYCPNQACPAQQVEGHGRNEEQAFLVITEKFHLDETKG